MMSTKRQIAWDVYGPSKNGRYRLGDTGMRYDKIDTVFFNPDCDGDYVRDSLINHDGYHPDIVITVAT